MRSRFNDMSRCYDASDRHQGRVTVKFVIGEDGVTKEAVDENSSMPDQGVDCVVRVFRELRFPASRGGNVAVIYPIQFGS